jgi:sporulation protein YlmC with PRC-barrel domain
MTTGSGPAMDAQLELLDRQIVDVDGRMVGKVDDVELAQRPDGRLVVTALLTGPGALGPRLGGALGAIVRSSWSRLSGSPSDRPGRIDIALVAEVGTAVRLGVSRREVDVDGFESWVRDHVVSALPGADGGAE